VPTADLSENEIAAAGEPSFTQFNAQLQPRITWEPSFAVVRSFRDQLVRAPGVDAETLALINKFVDRAERFAAGDQQSAAAAQLHALAQELEGSQYDALRASLEDLSASTKPYKAKGKPASPGASARAHGAAGGEIGDTYDQQLNPESGPAEE
jgi:hypothetical protein